LTVPPPWYNVPVLPAVQYVADVRRTPADVSAARQAGARWLAREAGHPVDDAAVVLAELLNNALMHTTGDIRLCLGWDSGVVTVEVWDCSPRLDRTPRSQLDAGGRGLVVVAGLAEDWGVRRHDDGKVVWASVREDRDGRAGERRDGSPRHG
jgi:anti-sigma regulatory factor (Ser/Thr protein kinase)